MADYVSSTKDKNISPSAAAPWVLVAGGFHYQGGMDKANAALAEHLIERQTPVHLVAHQVAPGISQHPLVTTHLVPRHAGSFFLGELSLERRGQTVARQITSAWPAARVLVNGGNCNWPDINWVHSVHHAWPCIDNAAPAWFKMKNRLVKRWAMQRESNAIRTARLVIANSEQTKQHLVEGCHVNATRVHTIYLGNDQDAGVTTRAKRSAARAWLGVSDERPLVIFVGALGHDHNKGFDILWAAWHTLCERSEWEADLIVAGGGGVAHWQKKITQSRLDNRVRMLGFTDRISELFAAADLLVSPVRYEAYGLNVQEAICRGVPAMVSANAGVTERYTANQADMILPDPEDVGDLINRLLRWQSNIDYWKEQFAPLAQTLRSYTWADMAGEMVTVIEENSEPLAASALTVCNPEMA